MLYVPSGRTGIKGDISISLLYELSAEYDTMKAAWKTYSREAYQITQGYIKLLRDYHPICTTKRSTSNQERNETGGSLLSPVQVCIQDILGNIRACLDLTNNQCENK